MRKTSWSDLFYGARYTMTHQDSFAKNFELSSTRFPALKHLKSFSHLEVLLLAYLIMQLELEEEDQMQTFSSLSDALDVGDDSLIELEAALQKLIRYGWAISFSDGAAFHYAANRSQLEADGLYEHNPWNHLVELGLYAVLCDN